MRQSDSHETFINSIDWWCFTWICCASTIRVMENTLNQPSNRQAHAFEKHDINSYVIGHQETWETDIKINPIANTNWMCIGCTTDETLRYAKWSWCVIVLITQLICDDVKNVWRWIEMDIEFGRKYVLHQCLRRFQACV